MCSIHGISKDIFVVCVAFMAFKRIFLLYVWQFYRLQYLQFVHISNLTLVILCVSNKRESWCLFFAAGQPINIHWIFSMTSLIPIVLYFDKSIIFKDRFYNLRVFILYILIPRSYFVFLFWVHTFI